MNHFRVWGLELSHQPADDDGLKRIVAKNLALRIDAITSLVVIRRSLDARKRRRSPRWVYVLDVHAEARPQRLPQGVRIGPIPEAAGAAEKAGTRDLKSLDAVVVGTGPAGLFAALALARRGARVRVVEQGPRMKDRVRAVAGLWRAGELDPGANVQCGEGGAGTFSDGKLTTRSKDPLAREVLAEFVACGAPACILEEAKPHLGTDGVRSVISTLRAKLEGMGVAFGFQTGVTGLDRREGAYLLESSAGPVEAEALFLGVGHSSRPLLRSLGRFGVPFVAKGFAVGFRAEHPQAWLDERQYGERAGRRNLPPAEYALTFQDDRTGRGVYSFCMCAGGLVVNSSSEPGGLVTNGMSLSHRASGFANAGIVVTVRPGDFGADPFLGMAFQEELERKAYAMGGGGYVAPAQTARGFLEGKMDGALPRTTFRPGVRAVDLRGFLPANLEEPLALALLAFDRRLPGFVEKGLLIAPETRTSCPLQVKRAPGLSVEGFPGLYLIGEGAGWSGGIVSSAVDALRCVSSL